MIMSWRRMLKVVIHMRSVYIGFAKSLYHDHEANDSESRSSTYLSLNVFFGYGARRNTPMAMIEARAVIECLTLQGEAPT